MTWRPDKQEALKKLIRETIRSAGTLQPTELPHHVREQLKSQVDGDIDLDLLIRAVLEEQK
ncbi:MAG: hypothetical protein AAF224_10495 [Pseudomonadota bacterium]